MLRLALSCRFIDLVGAQNRVASTSQLLNMPAKKKGGVKRKAESPAPDAGEKKAKEDTTSSSTDTPIERCTKTPNWKISSWNVNGIRAWLKKDGLKFVAEQEPDIFTMQETKCSDADLPEEVKSLKGYHTYWAASVKKGYAGVGLLSKTKPISVSYGLGQKKHDDEGRLITAEYDAFYLVSSYVPNSGRGLVRLQYRTSEWDADLRAHLKALDAKKPVIFTGDLNVSHKEIDLKNPKSNVKNAGFTPEERRGFDALLALGFKDSFRRLYPGREGAYTYWSYMGNARAKNVGWRLDYFVVSERLEASVCDNVINSTWEGSDHCPITLTAAIS